MVGNQYSTTLSGNNGIAPIPEGLHIGNFAQPGPWQGSAMPVPQARPGPKGILPDIPTVLYPKRTLTKMAPASNYDPNNVF